MTNNNPENCNFLSLRRNLYLTTTNDIQMATMKKAAKAKAVKKGTFYECSWCGKEGTDAPCCSYVMDVVCGRPVKGVSKFFCSEECQYIYCAEYNRCRLIKSIDFTNKTLDDIKRLVTNFIKKGEKVDPVLLQIAKLMNIYKKVATFIVSGDKSSARKLYDEKKELITDYAEDMLADKVWGDMYMFFINRFAEVDGMLRDDCSF